MTTSLKRIRREHGFSARVLAELLNLNESTIIHWQEGVSKHYPRNARKLELALNTPLDVLLAPENANGPATEGDRAESPIATATDG